MPPHTRINDGALAAGRARQRLKLAALGYYAIRHGIDADETLVRRAVLFLRKMALEYVETLPGLLLKNRRVDLYEQIDSDLLQLSSIAYGCSRHGIDADAGMAKEGLAMVCQASIDYGESFPRIDDAAKKATTPHFQLGMGQGH